jgi:glucoamylase
MTEPLHAPGWPGIEPRWTSSAKTGVGTALTPASRLWFTLSHGIVNEVYFPRLDTACIRDLGLVVTGSEGFFSEEKRHTESSIRRVAPGVPAHRITNTCRQGRYRVHKEVIADPRRETLLQRMRFEALRGEAGDYHLHALLAPHLGNRGWGNSAWLGDYKGVPMLFARRDRFALALACTAPWRRRSVGFVGVSDGWQDLHAHGELTWEYERADDGNVALCGEVDLAATGGSFVLVAAFGLTPMEAGHRAVDALTDPFDELLAEYVQQWQEWQGSLGAAPGDDATEGCSHRTSTMVLRVHEAKSFPGGMIASLAIPWGFNKADDDLGGYHLVWPRDLCETAGGLLAAGAHEDARRVISYLQATQEADGNWAQNLWLDGTPYWGGVQMDETAFPILLLDLARRVGALRDGDVADFWPMVRRAASYLVRNGPVTQQDRWEEDAGYSPFTLAVEISALLAAADLAELNGEGGPAAYLRETADAWNEAIERWTFATGTELSRRLGVPGYYVRIAPPQQAEASSPREGFVPIKNRPPGESQEDAVEVVSPDALALVRFGLRAADDPHITATVRVVDELLKVELPTGPAWHRYNEDGYGEHEDGSPFDGTGVGRAWPLLTGERAHYELAAGRGDEARRLLTAMESFANAGGMIPEQVWDAADIGERELLRGRPSGSAMPLVWAHAEHLKLLRSLAEGRVFDMPPQPVARYIASSSPSPFTLWRFNQKCQSARAGRVLRVETLAPARVHWSADGWRTVADTDTRDTGLGVHVADLDTAALPSGAAVAFTFFWPEAGRWEGTDFAVRLD